MCRKSKKYGKGNRFRIRHKKIGRRQIKAQY